MTAPSHSRYTKNTAFKCVTDFSDRYILPFEMVKGKYQSKIMWE